MRAEFHLQHEVVERVVGKHRPARVREVGFNRAVGDFPDFGERRCDVPFVERFAVEQRHEVARQLVREMNEFGARMVSDHPGRFAIFAPLALPDIEECPHCHQPKRPHHACPNCGYYGGRPAIDLKTSKDEPAS